MKPWEFFENLEENVYVVDMEDYTIHYMNKNATKTFKIFNQNEILGEKCYRVIRNRNTPCPFCKMNSLKEGAFCEWEHFNGLTGHLYKMKDTLVEENGQKYMMEIAVDMTSHMRQQEIIEKYTATEALINEALRRAHCKADAEASIKELIDFLGESLDADRTYIFEKTAEDIIDNTYEWCNEGIKPQIDQLQHLSIKQMVPEWFEAFVQNQDVIIEDIETIKENMPCAYECLQGQDIQSLLVVPLRIKDKIVGFYGVDNPPIDKMRNINVLLKVVSHFIASFMEQRNILKELERLSYYDQMTDIQNRHALKEHIREYAKKDSIGIIFADVTGLKQINDTYGHKAGDELLIRAVACLKSQFKEHELYRMGGDEFLVAVVDLQQDEFIKKIDDLKRYLEEKQVKMSVGSVWSLHPGKDMGKLIEEADQKMYQAKQEYYHNHNLKLD